MKKINTFFRGITFLMCLFSMTTYAQFDFTGGGGAIPDSSCPSGPEFTIEVSGVPAGYALSEVGLDIAHTWNGDLDIFLITPGGTSIELSTDNGGSGDGYVGVTLSDSSANTLPTTSGVLSGDYQPEEALANAGTETNGTWTLTVCDDTGFDTGSLISWSLAFVEPPCFAATGVDASFDLDNCGFVNVNIENVNDATSITDGTNTWAIAAAGITQVGPFAEGDSVTLSVIHSVSDCDFDLDTFDYSCPPANDVCSSAIALECDSTVTGSTAAATRDLSLQTCGTSLTSAPGVWYSITGTGGDITVDTLGSDYDTKLGVFTGSCDALECVGGDDDGPFGFGLTSQVIFSSEEGATYYVYVTGFSSNTGNYTLNVDCACAVSVPACTIVYTSFEPAASTDLTAVASYGVEPYSYDWSDGQSGQTITVAPTSTATYTVVVTDAEGCTTTGSTTVLVTDVDITCPNNNNSVKVTLCHDGQEICVSENAVQAHLNHGDFLGSCDPDFDCGTAPLCDAALKVPAPEATDVSVDIEIVWSAASGLVGGYYLSVGTTNGGTDILDNVDVGNTLDYDLSGLLDFGTRYYVSVVAYNDNGVATNCQANDYFDTEESPCNQPSFAECGNTYSGSTVGASVESGLDCSGLDLDTSGGQWFIMIGDGTEVTVDTEGSDFDTRLGVFTGSCDALNCVEGDDDDGTGLLSTVTFVSSPGTVYYIYVTGFSTREGNYDLNISCVAPPTCDDGIQNGDETGVDCGGSNCEECPPLPGQNADIAEDLTCNSSINANTTGYPTHPELAGCASYLDNAGGRWYQIVGTGGNITIDTNGSSFDTVLGLFTGPTNALTCVAADDDGGDGTRSLITFASVLSQTYYAYVSGFSSFSGFGAIVVNATCTTPPPACTDNSLTLQIFTDTFSTPSWDNNVWEIVDDSDNSVVASGGNLPANTTVSEELCLPNGCYTFNLYDGYGDGIFNTPAYTINGSAVSISGSGSFGYQATESFCVDNGSRVATTATWSMYPNPSSTGEVQLDLTNYLNQDVSIQMTDFSGKVLVDKNETNLQTPRYRLSTSGMAYGMYFVRVATESGVSTKKLMIANK